VDVVHDLHAAAGGAVPVDLLFDAAIEDVIE
jgi:hypothetical protein